MASRVVAQHELCLEHGLQFQIRVDRMALINMKPGLGFMLWLCSVRTFHLIGSFNCFPTNRKCANCFQELCLNKSSRLHRCFERETFIEHSRTKLNAPHIPHKSLTVVAQYYEADVNKEHVIRGNSAVIKCLIPSFVADFVEVVSWHTDQEENYFPGTEYGATSKCLLASSYVCYLGLGVLKRMTMASIRKPSFIFHFKSKSNVSPTYFLFCFFYMFSRFATLWRGYTQGVCHTRQFGHIEVWYTIVCSRFCKCYILAYRSGREFLSRHWIWCVIVPLSVVCVCVYLCVLLSMSVCACVLQNSTTLTTFANYIPTQHTT